MEGNLYLLEQLSDNSFMKREKVMRSFELPEMSIDNIYAENDSSNQEPSIKKIKFNNTTMINSNATQLATDLFELTCEPNLVTSKSRRSGNSKQKYTPKTLPNGTTKSVIKVSRNKKLVNSKLATQEDSAISSTKRKRQKEIKNSSEDKTKLAIGSASAKRQKSKHCQQKQDGLVTFLDASIKSVQETPELITKDDKNCGILPGSKRKQRIKEEKHCLNPKKSKSKVNILDVVPVKICKETKTKTSKLKKNCAVQKDLKVKSKVSKSKYVKKGNSRICVKTVPLCDKNDTSYQTLFSNWRTANTSWKQLDSSDMESFLPVIQKYIHFKVRKASKPNASSTWNVLNSFQSCAEFSRPCNSLFYVGNSVHCTAWCPVPHSSTKSKQYIAVATSASDKHIENDLAENIGLLQIWDVGSIQEGQNCNPKLCLSLVHTHGHIEKIVWCPTGAYDIPTSHATSSEILPRLGLAALACRDGTIWIYSSIPHPQFLKKDYDDLLPFYTASPTVALCSNSSSNVICTAMCWLETDKCQKIAAGYNDGLIRLFYLTGNSTTLLAYLTFRAHLSKITTLAFAPYGNGQWIVSSSFDKTIKLWDIFDVSFPSMIRSGVGKNISWLPRWNGFYINCDKFRDSCCIKYMTLNPDYDVTISSDGAYIKGFGVSKFGEILSYGDINGKVTATVVNKFRTSTKTLIPQTCIPIYYSHVEELENGEKSNHNSDKEENEISKNKLTKQGIVFVDVSVDKYKRMSKRSVNKVRKIYEIKHFAMDNDLMSVMDVAWNPNYGSHKYLFIATHSGLCRLLYFPGV